MKKYNTAIAIGRFQPVHNGHKHLIDEALKLADTVIVLVGSANKAVNFKNPFTFSERQDMIYSAFYKSASTHRVIVKPLTDFTYNDEMWVKNIQTIVNDYTKDDTKVAVVGHRKDDSSYYLDMFPQWDFVDVGHTNELNSTDIRELLYDKKHISYLKGVIPPAIYSIIESKVEMGKMDTLIEEYEFIKAYRKSWEVAPYPPTFLTADACVVQQGHVLLVKRGAMPGKGLWALPGGFIEQDETILDAAIRELREETKLKVPEPVLRGSIVANNVFDAPSRSLRGRTVTQTFLIHLTNYTNGLPKVKGSDDAMLAEWVPLADLKENEFFEDHYQMIQTMSSKL